MLDSDLIKQIILTIVTCTLTFIVGFVTAQLTQRSAEKSENKKLLREKIEKIYTLTNQAERWFNIQIWNALKLFGEEMTASPVFGFIHIRDITEEVECPFEEIQTISEMYVPSIKKDVDSYLYNSGLVRIVRNIATSGEDEKEIKLSLYGFCSRGIWTAQKEPKMSEAAVQKLALDLKLPKAAAQELALGLSELVAQKRSSERIDDEKEQERVIREYLHIIVKDFEASHRKLQSTLKKHKLIARVQLQ